MTSTRDVARGTRLLDRGNESSKLHQWLFSGSNVSVTVPLARKQVLASFLSTTIRSFLCQLLDGYYTLNTS